LPRTRRWRLRRADLPDLGGRLADHLLVDPLDDDLRRLRDVELDALAGLDRDRVRVADRELEVRALELRAVTDTLDLEVLLETLRDALDHVRDEGARQPVQRSVLASVGGARHGDLAVGLLDLHPRRDGLRELAERPVHLNAPRRDRDQHAGRKLDGSAADS